MVIFLRFHTKTPNMFHLKAPDKNKYKIVKGAINS